MDIIFWNWQIISDRRGRTRKNDESSLCDSEGTSESRMDDRLVSCIYELRYDGAQGLCPQLFQCVCGCER